MPQDNISRDVIDFVDGYLDSFVTWDVLIYFHENPHVEKKLSGIALDIGRAAPSLETVLGNLAGKGVLLGETEAGDEPSFRYTPTSEFRVTMERFIEATRDRTNRLVFVSRVLQKEARRL